ncbi:unnamed protein product [Phytophthora lilii]|uniref:Unnamed protein product n=1 Tax=Phytophthora lilii TaxID=2077276 RepID=A0A9W6UB56_9STRA|nr:unnamed protein product [Phytophthora lilii]
MDGGGTVARGAAADHPKSGTPSRTIPVDESADDAPPPESSRTDNASLPRVAPRRNPSKSSSSSSGGGSASRGVINQPAGAANRGDLLNNAELAALEPTKVPRDQWIPGYRTPSDFVASDVDPWSPPRTRHISVAMLDLEMLFDQFTRSGNWIFPARSSPPRPHEWREDLITETNVRALIESAPWTILDAPMTPISFSVTGWFVKLMDLYGNFKDKNLRSYWDATHAFPIHASKRWLSKYLASVYMERKQRRSRAGARWKSFLR